VTERRNAHVDRVESACVHACIVHATHRSPLLSVRLSVCPTGQPRLHGVYTNWPHLEPVYTPAARLLTSAIFRPQRKGLSTAHQLNRLQLSLCVCLSPALRTSDIPPVLTSRKTISNRPSNPLNAFFLAPHGRLLVIIMRVYKLYLLTY